MNRTKPSSLVLIASCLLFSLNANGQGTGPSANPFLPADAADVGWPTIRGPNLDGISAEIRLADSWPHSGPPVLWVKELGQGYSSFVVKDNRAYTQYQTLAGQYIICLDASSGATIWEHRYDWPFEAAGLYPGPRSTPTIANDRIYFATPAGSVGCLDLNGHSLWTVDLKSNFQGKGTDFGYACAPMIIDKKVIMPTGGVGASMVALDASRGQVIWKSGDSSASYTPAFPITVDGHDQVIGYLEHDLVAHDLDTGELLWKRHLSNGYDEHSAWPIYREPHLWTSAPFQAGSQLLSLSGGPDAASQRVWESPLLSNDVSSSVLFEGYLYGFDLAEAQTKAHRPSRGVFRCMHFLTGEPQWSNGDAKVRRSTDFAENRETQTIGHANVIVADRKLILFNDLGELILAEVNPNEYVELARTPALGGQVCWTSPALDRGRIFIRNHSRAICLYIGEPEFLSTVSTGDLLTVDDVPTGAVRDLSSVLGVEPAYAMDPPTYRWLKVWFSASLVILGSAALVAGVVTMCRRPFTPNQVRWTFWLLAGMLGMLVGTPASIYTGDFVFTWPVTLFIGFQITIYQSTIRRQSATNRESKTADRTIAVLFIALCLTYFLLCRRLSLVTEWVFLCGFAAASPFLLAGRGLVGVNTKRMLVTELAITLIAYTTFFWSAVVLLSLKYDISNF